MQFLASVGSSGPFIGLFGTVYGIMISFIGIANTNTTNLAVVAPGIAQALLATGIGLFAAIPSVIFYNYFQTRISGYGARSEDFLFGASAFTRKASLGIGGAIAGVALDLIHFPRGVPVEAVPREATIKLALLYGPAMLIFSCVAMSIMWTYDLTREKHADILRSLGRGE